MSQRRTMRQLIAEIRSYANQERFGVSGSDIEKIAESHARTKNNMFASDETNQLYKGASQLYRDTWLNPLLDELEERLFPKKKENLERVVANARLDDLEEKLFGGKLS